MRWHSFDAEVATNFGQGDLDPPAPDEPAQNLCGFGIEVGAQERLRFLATLGVPHSPRQFSKTTARKYIRFRGHTKATWEWLSSLRRRNPTLFAHWTLGATA